MTAAKQAGLKVFRTWGFNDKNVTYNPNGLPQYGGEGAGGTEVVFQWWSNGTSTIDVTPFDKVVNAAKTTGIKLVVALTNNCTYSHIKRLLYRIPANNNQGRITAVWTSTQSIWEESITMM